MCKGLETGCMFGWMRLDRIVPRLAQIGMKTSVVGVRWTKPEVIHNKNILKKNYSKKFTRKIMQILQPKYNKNGYCQIWIYSFIYVYALNTESIILKYV